MALSTESLVSALALSLKSHCFVSNSSKSLDVISLDLMLLLGKTKSHVNLYPVITLVDTRHVWKLGKSRLLSCLLQLSYVLLCCVLIFRSPPLSTPTLVTTFVCYPSFALCLLLCNQICAT